MTGWMCSTGVLLAPGLWVIICSMMTAAVGVGEEHCDRLKSRLVQKVIDTDIIYEYINLNTEIPVGCPMDITKSMYGAQERNKHREHVNKWVCYQCGKQFYEEQYLDNHMDRRHKFLQPTGDDITCLADLCDVFRCEVLATDTRPSYWMLALCNHDDLTHRNNSCQKLIKSCIPDYLDSKDKTTLSEILNIKLCKYLNCKDFWELNPNQVTPLRTAFYVMAFMVLSVALFIYYYIAYTHFYTDDSLLDQLKPDDRRSRHQSQIKYPPVPGRVDLRYRQVHS